MKHVPDDLQCVFNRRSPEKYPRQCDKGHRDEPADESVRFCHSPSSLDVFDKDTVAMDESPHNEGEIRTMPQPGQNESDEKIESFPCKSFPVSTKRYINIIAEPGGK